MSEIVEVVVTGPGSWVRELAEAVVADRTVACVHQVAIDAVYRWEGSVERDSEVRAMMHTTAERVGELEERVRREHPYDLPCVLTLTAAASADYAAWVRAETSTS